MIENTDSASVPSDSDMHDSLMAAAEAADRGEAPSPLETPPSATQGDEGQTQESETRVPDTAEDKQPDSPESSAEKTDAQGRKRGPDGKFLPKDEVSPTPEKEEISETQPEEGSKYERAKKDQARLEKTWKQVEVEKQAVRQEQARLQQAAKDLELNRQQANQPRFDSNQYQLAGNEFDKKAWKLLADGDVEGANEQRDLAGKAFQAARQFAQVEATEGYKRFESDWKNTAESLIKEVPELGDPSSEIAQQMVDILEKNPLLSNVTDGFRVAYQALKLQRDAAEASGLREENTKLNKEIERLNKLVSPQGGKPAGHSAKSTGFDNKTLDEQREILRQNAELADAA